MASRLVIRVVSMAIVSSLEVLGVGLNDTMINSAGLGADLICFSSFLFSYMYVHVRVRTSCGAFLGPGAL